MTPYEIKYSKMNICTYSIHTAVFLFLFYKGNNLNKIKQAGNQYRYNLQGLQKWKSKQSNYKQ